MERGSYQSQPVLIIGGGCGGLKIIKLFEYEKLFHVVGVVDPNPEAPAYTLAV